MDWIVAESFASEIELLIAKGKLEDAGIRCRATLNGMGDALLGGLGVQNGPCELMVQPKDLEKAKGLLG